MQTLSTRRQFLTRVGQGMLVAGVGYGAAVDMRLSPAWADDASDALTFGPLEPLVALMQKTPAEKLLPLLVERYRGGTDLKQIVAAGALANARTFGGEDYIGFHTIMAIAPSYHMAQELPSERRLLPVLKVLYRNARRIQEFGGHKAEVLHKVAPEAPPEGRVGGEVLRELVRGKNVDGAERTFAALSQGTPSDAFNHLLFAVEDNTEVHRIVLPYRAWDLLEMVGSEHAHTLLRQSVRYCVKAESWQKSPNFDEPRTVLPKLLDQYKLLTRSLGERSAEDRWVDEMCRTIFEATPTAAADSVAAALAEGMSPDALAEAISLAANQLILRDAGRPESQTSPNKPVGSVHGDSIGVHASDSANAWRNIARVSNQRNRVACLILGAYQVALDRVNRGGDFLHWTPWPGVDQQEKVGQIAAAALLAELETAIRGNDQARACALVHRCSALDQPTRPVFDLLLRYAVSEDGALHAEKFYRTVSEEFATARPAFRWRYLVALARVTASEYGQPAPGYAEACELLKLS